MAQETTTANALLGLLSLRSWTAYDLTQQMRRALRWVWPRSEANLYAALKKLGNAGLAEAIEEPAGGERTRTRYEITDEGVGAVHDWLGASDPEPPKVEAEVVLRAFLADLGSAEDLRRSLDATRRQCAEQIATTLPVFDEWAGDDPPFPERAHLVSLFIAFMTGHYRQLLEWCDLVEEELDTWPSTADVGMTPRMRAIFDAAVAEQRAIHDRHGAEVAS